MQEDDVFDRAHMLLSSLTMLHSDTKNDFLFRNANPAVDSRLPRNHGSV